MAAVFAEVLQRYYESWGKCLKIAGSHIEKNLNTKGPICNFFLLGMSGFEGCTPRKCLLRRVLRNNMIILDSTVCSTYHQ
jgi:hypothetical protein